MLVDGTVRRRTRSWTATVHHLLEHLEKRAFRGAPRALGTDAQGREVLTFLQGATVGSSKPWPAWTHSSDALVDVGRWLRAYHRAIADYVPPDSATWREGGTWEPGMIIGHGDPAPYNAVWNADGLVRFFDWDNAGPSTREDDVAWVAFAWTPLHAREVVEREGFTACTQRRARLEVLLTAYGWEGATDEVIRLVDDRLLRQIEAMRATAERGDPAFTAMLHRGQDLSLEAARQGLADL